MNEIYVRDISVNKLFDWFDQWCLVALEIPWQQEGTMKESWGESRHHAKNLRVIRAIGGPATTALAPLNDTPAGAAAQPVHHNLLGERTPTDLVDDEVATRWRKRS